MSEELIMARTELAESQVTQSLLADRYVETFALLTEATTAKEVLTGALHDVAIHRDAVLNILREISAIHRSGFDKKCEECGDTHPCLTIRTISGDSRISTEG